VWRITGGRRRKALLSEKRWFLSLLRGRGQTPDSGDVKNLGPGSTVNKGKKRRRETLVEEGARPIRDGIPEVGKAPEERPRSPPAHGRKEELSRPPDLGREREKRRGCLMLSDGKENQNYPSPGKVSGSSSRRVPSRRKKMKHPRGENRSRGSGRNRLRGSTIRLLWEGKRGVFPSHRGRWQSLSGARERSGRMMRLLAARLGIESGGSGRRSQ